MTQALNIKIKQLRNALKFFLNNWYTNNYAGWPMKTTAVDVKVIVKAKQYNKSQCHYQQPYQGSSKTLQSTCKGHTT